MVWIGGVVDFKYQITDKLRSTEARWDDVMELADEVFILNRDDRCHSAVFRNGSIICKLYGYNIEGYFWTIAGNNKREMKSFEKKLRDATPCIEVTDDRLPYYPAGGMEKSTPRITIHTSLVRNVAHLYSQSL